jgi:type IV secretion system protein VirD4
MTPGEIMRLPADDCLILARATPPIRAKKLRYFSIPQLLSLIGPPPPLRLSPQHASDWNDHVWREEKANISDAAPPCAQPQGRQSATGDVPDLFDEHRGISDSTSETI